MTQGKKPDAEVLFAFRMMMIKYCLKPSDILKIMVALDKENKPGLSQA